MKTWVNILIPLTNPSPYERDLQISLNPWINYLSTFHQVITNGRGVPQQNRSDHGSQALNRHRESHVR